MQIFFYDETEAQIPREGLCIRDAFWVVHPQKGLAFKKVRRKPMEALCSPREAEARALVEKRPGCVLKRFPAVYLYSRQDGDPNRSIWRLETEDTMETCEFPGCEGQCPKTHIFLGGTCGNNNWREGFIQHLTSKGILPSALFNPVVPNWNAEAQAREDNAKKRANLVLYYLADPMLPGISAVSTYSVVEATMALYDDPDRTVVVFDGTGLDGHQKKVMDKTEKDLRARFPKAHILSDLHAAILWVLGAGWIPQSE